MASVVSPFTSGGGLAILALHHFRLESIMVWDAAHNHADAQSQDRKSSVERAALANLHDEVQRVQVQGAAVVRVAVKPGDSIRDIGREVYLSRAGRMPTDVELKEFENDTASLNGLKSKADRDGLHNGQSLLVKLPAMVVHATPTEQHKAVEHGKPAVLHKTVEHAEAKVVAPKSGQYPCTGSASEVNQIAQWISHNEAGHLSFTAYNPNDNGHRVSAGLMQWNQTVGGLPELLQGMHRKNPRKFDGMFGKDAQHMIDPAWVRTADIAGTPHLADGLKAALADKEYQSVQIDMRNQHIERSCEIAKDYNFKSVRGRAVVADLVNQMGEGGTRSVLRKIPQAPTESPRIEQLKRMTNARTNGGDRVFSIEDKVHEIWRRLASAR